ncbi:MAG: O-antigen ligase domain-containing protein [Cyclobacteriaceae bacterium]
MSKAKVGLYILFTAISVAIAWLIATGGFKIGIVLLVVIPVPLLLIAAFRVPEYFLIGVVAIAFLISLLSRYVPGIPFGLSVDGILVLLILVLIFSKSVKFEPTHFTNLLSLALIGWLAFSFIEVFNPLAKSKAAWFYANRGLSIYPVMLIVLSIYLLKDFKYVKYFLIVWAVMALFGTGWGIKQLVLGVSQVEKQWLNAGAASTHILFGKLRVFSYFSDAAQFGASQAHTSLVFGIIALFPGKVRFRWLLFVVSLLSLYGMLISGTRGALAILAIGGFAYFVMTKNFRIVILGILFASGAFVFLKYTTILQSNYQINRLRSALDTNDPSLMVRVEREKVLEGYMADKPLGGGIGSAGYWGKRFTPGTFLAELGTDGHYTRLWMETGIIGLYLYYLMLAVIIFYLGRRLWHMEESLHRQILVAFYSAFIGLCVASYTNGLLTQLPTGPLNFISLAFVYIGTLKKDVLSSS